MNDHPCEVGGAGEHAHPRLAALVESRVGGLGAEDEEERERGRGELVGQRGRGEGVGREEGVVGGDGGGEGGQGGDRGREGEDDAGGERSEEVAQVAAGAAVLAPGGVVVERAAVADAALLDGVGPVGHRGEKGEHRVGAAAAGGFGGGRGRWVGGQAAGYVEAVAVARRRGFGRRRRRRHGPAPAPARRRRVELVRSLARCLGTEGPLNEWCGGGRGPVCGGGTDHAHRPQTGGDKWTDPQVSDSTAHLT